MYCVGVTRRWQKPMTVTDHDILFRWWKPACKVVGSWETYNRKISLHMVVRQDRWMLMDHHDLFSWQWPVKVQVAQLSCWHEWLWITLLNHTLLCGTYLFRPSKGVSPPPSPTQQSDQQILEFELSSGCKESQFYSLPFEQAVVSTY